MPLLVRCFDPLRRLAENLKVANNCVLKRMRDKDRVSALTGIFGDSANALENMLDIRALGFHNGTASRRTASRIRGLSERRITTCTGCPRSSSRSATRLPGNHGVVSPVTSTRRSTSLSTGSSPRATEPTSRTLPAPWGAAPRKIWPRWYLRSPAPPIGPLYRQGQRTGYSVALQNWILWLPSLDRFRTFTSCPPPAVQAGLQQIRQLAVS